MPQTNKQHSLLRQLRERLGVIITASSVPVYGIPGLQVVVSLLAEPRIKPKSWLEVEEVGRVSLGFGVALILNRSKLKTLLLMRKL